MLDIDDRLPDLSLETPDGGMLRLADMVGNTLVLFFYPKDDTSGCTVEAQDFTRLKAAFEMEGAHVLGISKGTSKGKNKFIEKAGLTVPLATDADESVCAAFGTWVEKSMYGRKYMGIDRATFLVDGAGRIAHVWRKVKVPGHAEEVLEAARALKGKSEPHAG
ncbi:peroxiredoxin [Sphingomonas prati]|uniref:thioredoxin-dependent peroxiredoxin n=1 Tax=Sphingomonas prati TaxID=1843237 RepID=A0A7W9EZT2_9SPHN|nr:peroxiredoxin [Sphingomonas prati]MBB5727591.1 peroxiredoxin Q/BCP [Sphingomonas prati]GGE79228.1 peroxiredoxin [Sphingomonas prati]